MQYIIRLFITILFLMFSGTVFAAEVSSASEKPNIVYILCDDLGYGDVHCLGGSRSKIPTPNIDRLASQGIIFTEAHSSSSVCTPTRYGILTGRYNWRSRLQSGVLDGYDPPLIAADRLTVPALLKQHGYHTSCIGKWHLGFTIDNVNPAAVRKKNAKAGNEKFMGAPLHALTNNGPITRGFDEFFGFHHARIMKSVFENDRVTKLIEPEAMLPALAGKAVAYIERQAKLGTPFFLYLPLSSPHTPIVPDKEWQGKSGLGNYADFVMETDWAVGEVITALKQNGIANNTLVIFTSDNGCSPSAGISALETQGHYPNELRRGHKADIWDGGHRVPFIASWPNRIKSGTQTQELICLTDLMATCAEIVGTKLPDNAGEDSVSILPAMLGLNTEPLREAIVHHSIQGAFAIRQGAWKLELCRGSGGWSKGDNEATTQLYNMNKHVDEKLNEYLSQANTVERLTKLLEKYVADGRSTPGNPQKNDVEIVIRKK